MRVTEEFTGRGRFEALLTGASTAACDQVLHRGDGWIVAPTLGSIVPNWLLVIPDRHELNFRDWSIQSGCVPTTILSDLAGVLGLASGDYIWFEHGPKAHGTVAGCGLDYAHLHFVYEPPFDFPKFAGLAKKMSGIDWTEHDAGEIYCQLPREPSYMAMGSGSRAFVGREIEQLGSQFFRRVISALVDDVDSWDYRLHGFSENIAKTVENFRKRATASNF